MRLFILLDTTVLTNFARAGLATEALKLWKRRAYTSAEALAEYRLGTEVAGLPIQAWRELRVLEMNRAEKAFAQTLPARLGRGERACIAIAHLRGAMFATDGQLARRIAAGLDIGLTGTLGILAGCIDRDLVNRIRAQEALDKMIAAGFYSPILNADDL